ncbi:MAG: hypothetical protein E6J02_05845 [Chloroflexi bacterium]|nr:MAG: hypothetical protein E6J02_05845 [Chloroflexota bacterium]
MKVLFVCKQNAGRSQMSEALFLRAAGGRHEAQSAGTEPAGQVHPDTRNRWIVFDQQDVQGAGRHVPDIMYVPGCCQARPDSVGDPAAERHRFDRTVPSTRRREGVR